MNIFTLTFFRLQTLKFLGLFGWSGSWGLFGFWFFGSRGLSRFWWIIFDGGEWSDIQIYFWFYGRLRCFVSMVVSGTIFIVTFGSTIGCDGYLMVVRGVIFRYSFGSKEGSCWCFLLRHEFRSNMVQNFMHGIDLAWVQNNILFYHLTFQYVNFVVTNLNFGNEVFELFSSMLIKHGCQVGYLKSRITLCTLIVAVLTMSFLFLK